jgi:hypothetical protein
MEDHDQPAGPRTSSPTVPSWKIVSENGPREGTRDLPRSGPDAGRRAVDADSLAGAAYGSLSRSLRRRRAELVALVEAGETLSNIVKSYQLEHPLEPNVTRAEVDAAVADAKAQAARMPAKMADARRSRVRNPGARV